MAEGCVGLNSAVRPLGTYCKWKVVMTLRLPTRLLSSTRLPNLLALTLLLNELPETRRFFGGLGLRRAR